MWFFDGISSDFRKQTSSSESGQKIPKNLRPSEIRLEVFQFPRTFRGHYDRCFLRDFQGHSENIAVKTSLLMYPLEQPL
ncbi:predicted protein [Arabidopsis lyrata subsp. lyrata]|uniref:Predicted protein n=1 Tax=Arabidopsis lyrata subsp. lyrata TaxID=81972 RepID=D7LE81_ARALL|nr:predicted protein [Arabidopsis lyrata subsp. lyrata]